MTNWILAETLFAVHLFYRYTMRRADFKRPTSKASTCDDAQQRYTSRRRETAVQIRKQNKDAVLRRKRGLPDAMRSETVAPSTQVEHLSSTLDSYWNLPGRNPDLLKRALSSSDQDTIKSVFNRLLQEDPGKARALVESLIWNLQQNETREATLNVWLDITSAITSADTGTTAYLNTGNALIPTTATASDDSDDSAYAYYGTTPLRWSDLLVSRDEPNTLIHVLLSLLQMHPGPQKLPPDAMVQVMCDVIGNLVQDAPSDTLTILLPDYWSLLVSHLPLSCYCCATIVRYDQIHYGMDFLTNLTPRRVADLLSNSQTAVDAAWMLEALSRREEEAIHALCGSLMDERQHHYQQQSQRSLVPQLLECIHSATINMQTPSAHVRNQFLIPALRAVCNLAWACEGLYRCLFWENDRFAPTIHRLLDDAAVLDVIYVVDAFLAPSLRETNQSSSYAAVNPLAVSNFVPRLVTILVSDTIRFEWKREAVAVLASVAILSDGGDAIVRDMMWRVGSQPDRERLFTALVELIQVPDSEAVLCALQIVDRLLRSIPNSSIVFANVGGVAVLEEVSAMSSGLSLNTQIASKLFDDFFDQEDDDDDDEHESIGQSSAGIGNDCFFFGSSSNRGFHFESTDFPTTSMPVGRGRGRTMPSWMQQQQQQQGK